MRLLRLLPRFQEAYRAMETLAAREQWTRGEIEAFQLERLNALWTHAAAHVPYYRELRTEHGIPPRFDSLAEFSATMPVTPGSAVRVGPERLFSERRQRGTWRRTSGTTGVCARVFHAEESHRESLRAQYRFYASWDIDIFDRTAFLWGDPPAFLGGWKGAVARSRQGCSDWLRNRIRLPACRLGPRELRQHLARISRFRPAMLYGYSSAVSLLAREAEECGFRCDTLRLVCLTSEPNHAAMRQAVARALGAPATEEYGSSECGFLAGRRRDGTLRVAEDIVLLETVPADDGAHEILLTPLTNPSFPLFRYAIGDVADAPLERPARGFAVLSSVVGRANDFLRARSGRLIHPTVFLHIAEKHGFPGRYRIEQDGTGAVRVLLELRGPAAVDLSQAQRDFETWLAGYPVTVETVERIPPSPAGKHRWLVSELTRDQGEGPPPASVLLKESHA